MIHGLNILSTSSELVCHVTPADSTRYRRYFPARFSRLIFVLLLLNFLLVIPSWFRQLAATGSLFDFWYTREIFRLVWGSVDLLIIISIFYFLRTSNHIQFIRRTALAFYGLLLIFEMYSAGMYLIFRRPPLIAEDIFLLKDAFYLIIDPSLKLWLPLIVAGLLCYALFFRLIPRLFDVLSDYFRHTTFPIHFGRLIIGAWILVGLVHIDWGIQKRDAALQLVSAHLVRNITTSVKFTRGIQATNFQELAQRSSHLREVRIRSKPDIYLIMLESYGKVMATHPDLRADYKRQMKAVQDSLENCGWFTATNYSASPVNGGGSWLSSATVLSGATINNEPLFNKFFEKAPGSLVSFLQTHGYTTFSLHPPDRSRPGIPIENNFGFDYQITYDSLRYQGKSFGWGLVPDQYSLHYTFEHYIEPTAPPRFLDFTTVSSHIPWRDSSIPPLPANWQDLNKTQPIEDHSVSLGERINQFFVRPYQTENIPTLIYYDFQVFQRFIIRALRRPSLILIIGDHQPPILANGKDGVSTPVHAICRDSSLISRFYQYGFVAGMYKAPDSTTEIAHQDIYPILAEILIQNRLTTSTLRAPSP